MKTLIFIVFLIVICISVISYGASTEWDRWDLRKPRLTYISPEVGSYSSYPDTPGFKVIRKSVQNEGAQPGMTHDEYGMLIGGRYFSIENGAVYGKWGEIGPWRPGSNHPTDSIAVSGSFVRKDYFKGVVKKAYAGVVRETYHISVTN